VVRIFSASSWIGQNRARGSEGMLTRPTIKPLQAARTSTRSADRRVCGLRLFVDEARSTARDDAWHGREAGRKIDGPRYLLSSVTQT
jgi:hypothetical protein